MSTRALIIWEYTSFNTYFYRRSNSFPKNVIPDIKSENFYKKIHIPPAEEDDPDYPYPEEGSPIYQRKTAPITHPLIQYIYTVSICESQENRVITSPHVFKDSDGTWRSISIYEQIFPEI